MKTKETSKIIYVTVVTSSLSLLANKIKTIVHSNEDIFEVCSEVANDVAKQHKLQWSNVLVQYFDKYSDEIPAMGLKVPTKAKVICNRCNKPKDGVETGLCNHCGRFGLSKSQSTREQALIWWDSLSVWGNPSKEYYMGLYYSDDNVTPERIEEIWKNEVQVKELSNVYHNAEYLKPNQKQYSQEEVDRLLDQQAARTTAQVLRSNQKQFKQFDEFLFKAYIDKFSDEDKIKMLQVLYFSQSKPASIKLTNAILDYTK